VNNFQILYIYFNLDDNDDDKNNKINNENLEICKKHEQNNKFPSYEIQKFKNDKHILCNVNIFNIL